MVRTAAHNAKIAAGMRAYHSRCKAGGAMTGRRGRKRRRGPKKTSILKKPKAKKKKRFGLMRRKPKIGRSGF